MTDKHTPDEPNPTLDDDAPVSNIDEPIDDVSTDDAPSDDTMPEIDEPTLVNEPDEAMLEAEPDEPMLDADADPQADAAAAEEPQTEPEPDRSNGDDMATPPPASEPPPPLPPVRRLRRADASSGPGVAAGIARYLGIETGLVKAAFVVASFFGGLGIFVYVAGWALIPRERHPDPRPVVINGSVAGIVIGTLALVGAVSVGLGAGGAAGSLLAPALLIGLGFYLLDQRSTPQVVTGTDTRPADRPSWIPPLTTTPLPPQLLDPPTSAYATTSPMTGFVDPAAGTTAPQWGSVLTDPSPALVAKPKPPVTAVTMAATALVVAVLVGLDQFSGIDVSVPQMFGSALVVIIIGIITSLFVGRALGLWFAGFIALIGWAVSPIAVAISVDGVGSKQFTVIDGADLEAEYALGTGELIVDLRDATFATDAETSIELNAGSIVVYLPDDVAVDLDANARFGQVIAPLVATDGGVGSTSDEVSGPSSEIRRVYDAREGAPTLTIDADVRFGSVEIRRG